MCFSSESERRLIWACLKIQRTLLKYRNAHERNRLFLVLFIANVRISVQQNWFSALVSSWIFFFRNDWINHFSLFRPHIGLLSKFEQNYSGSVKMMCSDQSRVHNTLNRIPLFSVNGSIFSLHRRSLINVYAWRWKRVPIYNCNI